MPVEQQDLIWVKQNHSGLLERARELYRTHGRGAVIVEPPLLPMAEMTQRMAYVPGDFFGDGTDARKLVQIYPTDLGMVIAFLRNGLYHPYLHCGMPGEEKIKQIDAMDAYFTDEDGDLDVDDQFRIENHFRIVYLDGINPHHRRIAATITAVMESGEKVTDIDLPFGAKKEMNLAPTALMSFDPEKITVRRAEYASQLEKLLRRFDLAAPEDWRVALEAWSIAGLPRTDFPRGNYRDVMEVLDAMTKVDEAKVAVHRNLRSPDRGTKTPLAALLKAAGKQVGGRPPEPTVNGRRLTELRGEISQERLAEICEVDPRTIFRGEKWENWDPDTFKKVAKGLSAIKKRTITVKQLKANAEDLKTK